jgi:hypothetical protein
MLFSQHDSALILRFLAHKSTFLPPFYDTPHQIIKKNRVNQRTIRHALKKKEFSYAHPNHLVTFPNTRRIKIKLQVCISRSALTPFL